MKAFYIASGIFLLSCLTVCLLTISTTKTAEGFLKEAEALYEGFRPGSTEDYAERLASLGKRWEEAEKFLTVTVHHEELSRVGRCIKKAEGAAHAQSEGLLSLSLAELCDALTHVYDIVRLSLDNII